MSNDNKATPETPEGIVERGMRSMRDETLAGAIEICKTIAGWGGTAEECITALDGFRDRLSCRNHIPGTKPMPPDVPPPAPRKK